MFTDSFLLFGEPADLSFFSAFRLRIANSRSLDMISDSMHPRVMLIAACTEVGVPDCHLVGMN